MKYGRQPQNYFIIYYLLFLKYGRRSQFCPVQPMKLIFSMQPYLNPYPQHFLNRRRPEILCNGGQPFFLFFCITEIFFNFKF
jgi:hypothetical protein